MSIQPKNILVIRNDKLGDFMLAWPTFQMVKQTFPDSTIYALVPEYTRPMAKICPWIDKIIVDDDCEDLSGLIRTTSKLKAANIDAVLNLHSTPRVALALFFSGIKHRFAPASRIDQVFYNHTLRQRRSRSEKPEYEYNLDLAKFMADYYGNSNSYAVEPPLLKFPNEETRPVRNKFYDDNQITADKKLVVVHAGSGGSAINLSVEQYAELIRQLSKDDSLFFVLSAGPGEEQIASQLSELVKDCRHAIYYSNKGIVEFTRFLSMATLYISGSTGTLHVAGALDVPTAAFFPERRSATSLRWQTLNSKTRHTAFSIQPSEAGEQVQIDLENVARTIENIHFRNAAGSTST